MKTISKTPATSGKVFEIVSGDFCAFEEGIMGMRRRVLAALVLAFGLACVVAGQEGAAGNEGKEAEIRRLLKLTGAGDMGKQMAGQMIDSMKPAMPQVPEQFWDDFKKEVNADDLVNLIVPIYDKHFSHDDIKGLIAFYESPLGKKLVAEQPQVARESMQAGRIWGENLGRRIGEKIQKEQKRLKQDPAPEKDRESGK